MHVRYQNDVPQERYQFKSAPPSIIARWRASGMLSQNAALWGATWTCQQQALRFWEHGRVLDLAALLLVQRGPRQPGAPTAVLAPGYCWSYRPGSAQLWAKYCILTGDWTMTLLPILSHRPESLLNIKAVMGIKDCPVNLQPNKHHFWIMAKEKTSRNCKERLIYSILSKVKVPPPFQNTEICISNTRIPYSKLSDVKGKSWTLSPSTPEYLAAEADWFPHPAPAPLPPHLALSGKLSTVWFWSQKHKPLAFCFHHSLLLLYFH